MSVEIFGELGDILGYGSFFWGNKEIFYVGVDILGLLGRYFWLK